MKFTLCINIPSKSTYFTAAFKDANRLHKQTNKKKTEYVTSVEFFSGNDKGLFTSINIQSCHSLHFTQGQHINTWILFLIILNESTKQISPFTLHPYL